MILIVCGSSRSGTTITLNIMNAHKDIQLLNEFRCFWDKYLLDSKSAEEYFKKLYTRALKKLKYYRIPCTYDFKNNFINDALVNLKEDSILGRVYSIHDTLNIEDWRYFGNKGADPNSIIAMDRSNVDFRLIYIHRDGRDVAASGKRHKRGMKPPWSNSASENAKYWGTRVKKFMDQKEILNQNKFIVIKFEDYIYNPGKNMSKVERLLDIEGLIDIEKKKINPKEAHKGYYNKHCPNWRQTFPPVAIEMLERLGYI